MVLKNKGHGKEAKYFSTAVLILKSFRRIAKCNSSLQGAVEVFLSEVSLGELLKEINKIREANCQDQTVFFLEFIRKSNMNRVSVICNLDKIEKWEMANRRLLFSRV